MVGRSAILGLFCWLSITGHAGIVDSHVHMPSAMNFGESGFSSEALIKQMDQSGVERAFILSSAYTIRDPQAVRFENDYVSSEIRKYPDRLYGFCGINPMVIWAESEMIRCQMAGNFIGMKIHTNAAGMDLSSEDTLKRLRSVFELANKFRWTVLIHSGQWSITDLKHFLFTIASFPQAKFILGHGLFEGFRNLILVDAIRKEMPGYGENLFMEVSGLAPIYADSPDAESLLWHMRQFGMDHVLFGSDYPIFTFRETLDSLVKMGLTPEEIHKVTISNFEALLPKSAPGRVPPAAPQAKLDKIFAH